MIIQIKLKGHLKCQYELSCYLGWMEWKECGGGIQMMLGMAFLNRHLAFHVCPKHSNVVCC